MQPKEFLLYYTAVFFVAAILIMRKKPRRGMLLRLRGKTEPRAAGGKNHSDLVKQLDGAQPPGHERPLNVVFNYNGESWDAYEVLGLPAGSSIERVEQAFQESLHRVDGSSKSFMEAAYQAIKSQWASHKISKGS